MQINDKIKVPITNYIKKYTKQDGTEYYSFLYKKSILNEETKKWEVKEEYVVNITNIEPIPESEIVITKITGSIPKTMIDKKGVPHLNCCIWCEAEMYGNGSVRKRRQPKELNVGENYYSSNQQRYATRQPEPKPKYEPSPEVIYEDDLEDGLPF